MPSRVLFGTGCIVVHHRHFPDVLEIVDDVLAEGVPPENIVLVDNSEDEETKRELLAALGNRVQLEFTKNLGYGAAVNVGVTRLLERDEELDVLVVATHEVRLARGSIAELANAIAADPLLGATGPVLLVKGAALSPDGERVWSAGGEFTKYAGRPFHRRTRVGGGVVDAGWLDGAIVAYRREALVANPFDESWFMYFEEVDLHVRLRDQGWRVAVVETAAAWQSTSGVPPYYQGRNGLKFASLHLGRVQRLPYMLREFARVAMHPPARTSRGRAVADFLRGAGEGGGLRALLRR